MDAVEDGYVDNELFSLTSIKGKKDLVAVDNNEDGDADANSESGESDDESGNTSSDIDSEEERIRYGEKMEELLDEAYEHILSKREGSSKQRKRIKHAYLKNGDTLEDDVGVVAHSDQDSDNEMSNHEANHLLVDLEENVPTKEEIVTQWFTQDVFDDIDEQKESDKDESEDEMQVDTPARHPKKVPEKRTEISTKKPIVAENDKSQVMKPSDNDFEVVPAPETDSSDSSSDESDIDDINTKAEILACAKKMLTKKQRENMLDDAYNKYMFHDDVGLPKWFLDEEKKHYQPMKPITKEEVNAMRAQFKEINARPAKKVAQAKARKKRDAHRTLEKVRKKANTISDQSDISDRSKGKMIEQLYKKAGPKKVEREYVVAKKGVQVKPSKGKVLVDPRMKKDRRTTGMNKKGKGKGKGGGKSFGKRGKKPQKG